MPNVWEGYQQGVRNLGAAAANVLGAEQTRLAGEREKRQAKSMRYEELKIASKVLKKVKGPQSYAQARQFLDSVFGPEENDMPREYDPEWVEAMASLSDETSKRYVDMYQKVEGGGHRSIKVSPLEVGDWEKKQWILGEYHPGKEEGLVDMFTEFGDGVRSIKVKSGNVGGWEEKGFIRGKFTPGKQKKGEKRKMYRIMEDGRVENVDVAEKDFADYAFAGYREGTVTGTRAPAKKTDKEVLPVDVKEALGLFKRLTQDTQEKKSITSIITANMGTDANEESVRKGLSMIEALVGKPGMSDEQRKIYDWAVKTITDHFKIGAPPVTIPTQTVAAHPPTTPESLPGGRESVPLPADMQAELANIAGFGTTAPQQQPSATGQPARPMPRTPASEGSFDVVEIATMPSQQRAQFMKENDINLKDLYFALKDRGYNKDQIGQMLGAR